ncbi:MAG TPA: hypothetical protein VJY62_10010 [Bacteroidia bacterium]|nr:hypothetical protein [Bacteroidia bacterium]
MIKKIFLISVCFLISVTDSSIAQFYQGSQQSFGKNRVQYNDFLWTFYRFKNFDTYFYLGGQELAAFAGKTGDKDIEDIEKLFDYKTSGRIQFIIFNKLSDMKQTNIGLEGDEQEGNIGGMTKIFGNKVLIYFDGNHEHFRQELRAGVAKVLIEQLMYGGNVKDRVQSAVLLNLPSWYVDGLVSYVSTGWTVEDDNRMRDGIVTNKYRKFNRMLDNQEIFAGKSMWHYTVETFGPGSVSNLLYMTRINRNIESGYVYVIGSSLSELSSNWLAYYQKLYLNADKSRSLPKGDPVIAKPRNNRIYSQVKISPDGSTLAYVTNDIGKYRIWLYDLNTKKKKRLMKGGYKSVEQKNDLSFPLLAWHPSGRILAIMKEKKGKVYLDYYNVNEKKKEENKFFYFEKVLDFSYSDDGQNLVLSGVQKGQSDIYVFNVRTRTYQQVTKDIYDDLNPRFVMGSKFIIFSSNRMNDSLGTDNKKGMPVLSPGLDIFLYDNTSNSQVLKRVTNTPLANEIEPIAIDSSRFSFLSDQNGIYNRYNATIDSMISFIDTTEHYRYIVKTFPQTDYARNIEEHDLNYRKTKYAEVIYSEGKYRMFVNPNPAFEKTSTQSVPPSTPLYDQKNKSFAENKKPQAVQGDSLPKTNSGVIHLDEESEKQDSNKIDINNYVFQSEFPRKKKKIQEKAEETNKQPADSTITIVTPVIKKDSGEYVLPKQRNYDPAFSSDYFILQLDNQLLNATYQTFTGGAVYFDPGLTGLLKIGINDLMNDYKITGGFRLAGDLNSNEYLLSYENLKRRIDKQILFFRQAREFALGFAFAKVHTHEVKYVLKYPFNDLTALRGTIAYRNDRTVVKSTDINALQFQNFYENWGSVKLEYIFDNTIKRGLNLRNGMRYKIFAEAFRQVNRKKTFMSVFGVDFRAYVKVHRQIVWANRISASTSLGDLKLIYYLGSEDNAIVPADNFDYSINIDPSQNYAFQTIATPMRGFVQNIRNGNSFALVNSELRIPVFQYLFRRPIRSDFIRNFQVVGFGDIGTAWTGLDPYAKNNALNTQTISGNPITVVLYKQIEPIVAGYGVGVRSRIFGYFLKGDWGWGYEDGEWRTKPIFYLSLGLDF